MADGQVLQENAGICQLAIQRFLCGGFGVEPQPSKLTIVDV